MIEFNDIDSRVSGENISEIVDDVSKVKRIGYSEVSCNRNINVTGKWYTRFFYQTIYTIELHMEDFSTVELGKIKYGEPTEEFVKWPKPGEIISIISTAFGKHGLYLSNTNYITKEQDSEFLIKSKFMGDLYQEIDSKKLSFVKD